MYTKTFILFPKRKQIVGKCMEEKILLECIAAKPQGIRELIGATGWKSTRCINMLRKFEQEGLIEFEILSARGRGRPKKVARLTALGQEALSTLRSFERLCIKTNLNDARRAVLQARDTKRLVAAGRSPYQMLWELDEIVRAVRNSAKVA